MTAKTEALRAPGQGDHKAFLGFLRYYVFEPQRKAVGNMKEWANVWPRADEIMKGYVALSLQAHIDGFMGEKREEVIQEGMIKNGWIDQEDPAKAAHEYKIISEGYNANVPFWEDRLGKVKAQR